MEKDELGGQIWEEIDRIRRYFIGTKNGSLKILQSGIGLVADRCTKQSMIAEIDGCIKNRRSHKHAF